MMIHNKDDIQFVTEFPCFWDTLYDDSTARLNRFLHIALKLTLGLQTFCSLFRFALFDGEIYHL